MFTKQSQKSIKNIINSYSLFVYNQTSSQWDTLNLNMLVLQIVS